MAFREAIKQGKPCLGTWVTFSDPAITELLAQSGFDFLLFDMEHAPLSVETIQNHLLALNGFDTTPLVRVPWNDLICIKRVLDIGAAGVMVPYVRTAAEVEQALVWAHYPPRGIRGIGPRRPGRYGRSLDRYFEMAPDEVIVIAQIENQQAVQNIEEILRVPGLTAIYFGPNDLAASMGLFPDTEHPAVIEAMERVTAAAKVAGIPVGQWCLDASSARHWARKGANFTALSLDFMLLAQAADALLAETGAQLSADVKS